MWSIMTIKLVGMIKPDHDKPIMVLLYLTNTTVCSLFIFSLLSFNRIPPPDHGESDNTLRPILTSITNSPESDLDSDHSPTNNMSAPDKITGSSRAIVVVPPMNVEALAVVPLRKPKRSELAQRRIRRPFSVAEVEALVQAVEKLGTGRFVSTVSVPIGL